MSEQKRPYQQHHVEAFRQGYEPDVKWGWQCLTCDDEGFTATLAEAEHAVEAHENATAKGSS